MTKAQRESLVIILREYRYYLSVYKNTVDKLNHELSIVEPTVDPDTNRFYGDLDCTKNSTWIMDIDAPYSPEEIEAITIEVMKEFAI